MGDKLFPQFYSAVEALRKCCGEKDEEIPPIARSEVYNETWMLRLTLALLHDSKCDFSKINDADKQETLKLTWDALQRNWISEGGLKPAFDKEGTTWADAILGDVTLEEDKSKRGVKVDDLPAGEYHGVVVVEAKMGSALDSGITNSSDYNQAARNIACLAKLVENKGMLCENCAFLVFAPKQKLHEWKEKPIDLIREALQVINDQEEDNRKHQKRTPQWKDTGKFVTAVNDIVGNSVAISWEEVIESINCEEDIGFLREFYNETCKEFGITPQFECC